MAMNQNVARGQISCGIVVLAASSMLSSCYRGAKEEPTTPGREPYAGESWERQVAQASPAQVPGTQARYEQTSDGAAITFTTRGDVDEVRRRAERIAELHDRTIEVQVYEEQDSSFESEHWCPLGHITWAQCRIWCDGTMLPIPPRSDAPHHVRIVATVDEIPGGARIRFTLDDKELLHQLTGDYAASVSSLRDSPGLRDVCGGAVSPGAQVTYGETSDVAAITFTAMGDVDQARCWGEQFAELYDRRIRARVYRERTLMSRDDEPWDPEGVISCRECEAWCDDTSRGVRIEPVVDEIPDGARIRLTLDGKELLRQLMVDFTLSLVLTPGLPDDDANAASRRAGRVGR